MLCAKFPIRVGPMCEFSVGNRRGDQLESRPLLQRVPLPYYLSQKLKKNRQSDQELIQVINY